MSSQIFVNLPVKSLDRSVEYFAKLGYRFDPRFTDANATCIVIGEGIFAMLLVEPYFQTFTPRPVADATRGTEVLVPRSALPPPAPGEYYWVDLEGLRVVNTGGVDFGIVSHLFSTGANDVLVAQGERERMIPFKVPDYIVSVDFDAGVVTVDWDADF